MDDQVTVDRAEWEATQARLRAVEERLARLDEQEPALPPPPAAPLVEPAEPTSRRRALIGMAAAGAGAAALVAGQAAPAAANGQGQSWTLGDPTNTATATTGVTANLAGAPAVSVKNSAAQRAILGVAGSPSGNGGTAAVVGDAASTDGVFGLSGTGRGVAAISTSGAAMAAYSVNGTGLEAQAGGGAPDFGTGINTAKAAIVAQSASRPGVIALSGSQHAVIARSDDNPAVWAYSQSRSAVLGESVTAAGLEGRSENAAGVNGTSPTYGVRGVGTGTSGPIGTFGFAASGYGIAGQGRLPLHLYPSATNVLPAGGVAGNVWVAANGTQWACVAPDQWRIVVGSATAGALHVLPAPARVYDSRPGTLPAVGLKTKLVPNQGRTIDLTVNGSGVPAGARAALLTVLLVNAANGNGNITVWANGVTKPQANTLVWGGATGRFTATATSALDAQARIQVLANLATDVVIDVVGYYR